MHFRHVLFLDAADDHALFEILLQKRHTQRHGDAHHGAHGTGAVYFGGLYDRFGDCQDPGAQHDDIHRVTACRQNERERRIDHAERVDDQIERHHATVKQQRCQHDQQNGALEKQVLTTERIRRHERDDQSQRDRRQRINDRVAIAAPNIPIGKQPRIRFDGKLISSTVK